MTINFAEPGITHATRKQGNRFILFITISIALYEIVQYMLPRGVFDWNEVIAILVTGFLA